MRLGQQEEPQPEPEIENEEEELEDEEEGDEEDEQEEEEEPQQPEASDDQDDDDVPAPVHVADTTEDEDDASLRNLLSDEHYAAMRRIMQREMRQQIQSMTASSIHVTAAAAQNPELFRLHGAKIQHKLSQLDPGLRAKPEAVNIAIAGLLIEEANTKGIGPTLAKYAKLVGNQAPAPKAPKAPIPASQRPPSPSSGNARPLQLNKEEARVKALMDNYGLTKAEAMAAMADSGVLR